MKDLKQFQTLRNNQDGIAAFFVTIMVMVIFGILILSFSQISNKEGTNALNRELSTQALYAAQSGINNTYSIIKNLEDEDKPVPQQTGSCSNPNYSGAQVGDAQYTCILVNTEPNTLQFACPTYCPNNSIIAHVESVDSETDPFPMDTLKISWKDAFSNPVCNNQNPNFPPAANWGNCPPVLQVNLVPFSSGTDNVAALNSSVETFFLYPNISSSNPSIVSSSALNGQIYNANCSGATCSALITGLTSTEYYVRIQYYYGVPSEVDFNGYDNSTPIAFSYSQIQIDSTGISQNGTVLKRLSAYINPLSVNSLLPPNYAIQSSNSICKSLVVDNYSNATTYTDGVYEIVPPNSSLDPYTDLGLTLNPSSINNDLKTNNPPSDQQLVISAPLGLNTPTPAYTATSTPPIENNQTEVTTDTTDPCNPI